MRPQRQSFDQRRELRRMTPKIQLVTAINHLYVGCDVNNPGIGGRGTEYGVRVVWSIGADVIGGIAGDEGISVGRCSYFFIAMPKLFIKTGQNTEDGIASKRLEGSNIVFSSSVART